MWVRCPATNAGIQADALALGRARKRANALAALVAGGVPAIAFGFIRPLDFKIWAAAFAVGLLWANGFEYVFHRYLLHRPRGFFARGHLRHHGSVGTPHEAEHLALGRAPMWIVALFATHGAPIITFDLLFRVGVASPMLAAFTLYEIAAEELHWRFHVREGVPKWLTSAREHHLQHHDRPDERFNVFLPIFDTLFRKPFPRPDCRLDQKVRMRPRALALFAALILLGTCSRTPFQGIFRQSSPGSSADINARTCVNAGQDERLNPLGIVCWLQRHCSYKSGDEPKLHKHDTWAWCVRPPYLVCNWRLRDGHYRLVRIGWRYDRNWHGFIGPGGAWKAVPAPLLYY